MSNNSHIKSTFRNAIIYSGATIVSKIIAFFMLPVYAHYLQAEGYGIIGMVDVVISVATMMIGHGVSGSMWRFYYQKETEEERNTLVSSTLVLMLVMVVTASLPLLIFHEQLGTIAFGKSGLGFYIVIASLTFICEMTSKTAEAYILIRQKALVFTTVSILRIILGLSLNIYFVVHLELGIMGVLYSSLICGFAATVFMHVYAISKVGIHFSRTAVREVLGWSVPLLPGYIAMFVRGNADRVIMRTTLGLAQLGAYEMLNKFVSLLGVFIVEPFSKSWDAKRYEICDNPEGPGTMAKMFTIQVALLIFVGMVLALEIPLLLRVLTPKEFWLGQSVAALMVVSRILNAAYYQLNFGLNYAKKTSTLSRIQIVSSVLDVGLNASLIPLFGILGAAVASCVVAVIQCVMAFFGARGYYPIFFQWRKIIQILLAGGVIFAAISQLSLESLGIAERLNRELAPTIHSAMTAMHLDAVKNGKLIQYTVNNISIIINGCLRLILSLIFIPTMIYMEVFPRRIFSLRVIRDPLQKLTEVQSGTKAV
ncbi:hypothetical protein RW64_00605 [Geobacter sulfurreducens]|nr:hypothetical protein RW64_00605 [Geobacter sulfurreducens]